jgi:hypothetical protein
MARVDGMLALLLEADFSQRVRCHGEYRSVKRAFSRASARAKLLSPLRCLASECFSAKSLNTDGVVKFPYDCRAI